MLCHLTSVPCSAVKITIIIKTILLLPQDNVYISWWGWMSCLIRWVNGYSVMWHLSFEGFKLNLYAGYGGATDIWYKWHSRKKPCFDGWSICYPFIRRELVWLCNNNSYVIHCEIVSLDVYMIWPFYIYTITLLVRYWDNRQKKKKDSCHHVWSWSPWWGDVMIFQPKKYTTLNCKLSL